MFASCDRSGSGRVRLLTKAIDCAVGRPGGVGVVEGTRGDLDGGLLRDVEDVDVLPDLAEVAFAVALELQAAQDDRLRRLLLPSRGLLLVLLVRRVGVDVLDHEGEPLGVGGPGEVRDRGLVVGELHRLAALPAHEVHLRLLPLAVREERDPLAVRAEAGARVFLLGGREAQGLAAVRRHEVDVGVGVVLLRVERRERVGDPPAVGAEARVRDVLQREHVVRPEGPPLGREGRRSEEKSGGGGEGSEDGCAHGRGC